MDASGPIPFRAAAAYGTPRPSVTRSPGDVRINPPQTGTRASGNLVRPNSVDQVNVAPTPAAKPSAIDTLVAGSVRSDINRGVGFDGDPPSLATSGMGQPIQPSVAKDAPLQLYNRHADRLEAATSVALGRTLDIQG